MRTIMRTVVDTVDISDKGGAASGRVSRRVRSGNRAPRGWWQGDQGRERAQAEIRQMLRELGWSELSAEELARRVTYGTFLSHGLSKMLDIVYGSSPYAALHDLFPALEPWQMKHTPQGYWQGEEGREHAQEATRWMLARLGLAKAEPTAIAQRVDQGAFDSCGLRGMLEIVYGDSPYAALVDLYPTLYPWQMAGGASVAYWNGKLGGEHARIAIRWMVDQMGLSGAEPGDVARQVTSDTFEVYGLTSMLSEVYSASPYAALKDVYPSLQPWEMARVPRSYWQGAEGREHAQAAMRWMLAQLGLADANPEAAVVMLDEATFFRLHLMGMLEQVYDCNPSAAITDLYGAMSAQTCTPDEYRDEYGSESAGEQ